MRGRGTSSCASGPGTFTGSRCHLPAAGQGTELGTPRGPGCVSRRCSQEYRVRGPTLQNVSPEPSGMVLRGAGAG